MMVYVKYMGPWAGAFFGPKGYNLNNLDRGPLDKAVYQISKAWAF